MLQAQVIESMLVRLMLTPQLMRETGGILQSEHFHGPEEQHYALLWRAMQDAYQKYGKLEYNTVRDTVQLMAAQSGNIPDVLLESLLAEDPNAWGLVPWAFYGANPAGMELELSRECVRHFLQSRYVYQPLAAALAANMTSRLPQILADTILRQQRLTQVDVNPVVSALPDNWAPQPTFVEPTGCSYFDIFMDGGDAPGEVNGILGPMGTGKTMLAVNLACNKARYMLSARANPAKRNRRIYLVTYEQSADEIRKRLLCCAASIDFSSLREMTSLASLSSKARGDYKPYERDRHIRNYDDPDQILLEHAGETERLEVARPILRDIIQIIDLSGNGPNARPGVGYVDEIVGLIEADQQACGNPGVASVIVDYVLLAAQRYMAASGLSVDKHTRHTVAGFVDQMKQRVAGRFQTAAWLLHQLNTEGNKGNPTRVTSHTQAAESGAFAAALSFCACLSTKDVQSNCCLLNFSKRRRAGEYIPPKILHIHGSEATVLDGDELFAIDLRLGRIVTKQSEDQYGGGNTTNVTPVMTEAHTNSAAAVTGGAY